MRLSESAGWPATVTAREQRRGEGGGRPRLVTVYLDRPAILNSLRDRASALIGNFGVSDAALLDVVTGKAQPEGKLPFELPSSAEAVARQKEDVPYDSENPLFPFGHGLTY